MKRMSLLKISMSFAVLLALCTGACEVVY
jgi:hypothetical protein